MPEPTASQPPESWLESSVAATWPGGRPGGITRLKGDASRRQFWRVAIEGGDDAAPATAIAVDLGPDDLPLYARALSLYREPLDEPPFLNVHRFLESIGAPAPALYFAAPRERLLLVEDVGDRSLFQAAAEKPERAAVLYRAAVDELLRLHVEGTARRDERCIAFGVNYDQRLFAWELEQFIEVGLKEIANGADPEPLKPELADLAARLGRLPRVFSHRDYHGNNLFVQSAGDGAIRIRIIDFQDALMAPAAQDLAVLMTTRDTARVITPEIESRLLDYYLAGLARRRASSLARAEFVEGYRLCVVQHAIKMIGRFVWLERQGKPGYTSYLPDLVAQAGRMLARARDFPRLRDALGAAR
jgi:aminoglycoside/choline kinase family phosphotransferase